VAIVRIDKDRLEALPTTSLRAEGVRERVDLQRLLKKTISVIGSDLLVIAEEFGEWEESRRRIDLLALDRNANLVVVELKRDDSSHMELQAVRYAAMISAMSFGHVVSALQAYMDKEGVEKDAEAYAAHHDPKIVLIDGNSLADLMIDYDIGVVPVQTYELKRLDSDSFSEE
jgi:hypothetical protein